MSHQLRCATRALPAIIQGGMGVGISTWTLARAVSRAGQLGVVSGTALDAVLSRRLQQGDPGGHMARALAAFPVPEIAQRVLEKYLVPGGLAPGQSFRNPPLFALAPRRDVVELMVVANFAEVYLAKEGHGGKVGVNYLEKIQLPFLPALYGALLAGVDCVLVGAGIPREVPRLARQLAAHEAVSMKVHVQGATGDDDYRAHFAPAEFLPRPPAAALQPPAILAIISSATLALTLARRSAMPPDGFVVEGPNAGGHNAPPRGARRFNGRGEPLYGPRDESDLEKIGALGLPFWLAGSYGSPGALGRALALGAAGIQVGTAFAFCRESGFPDSIKQEVIATLAGKGARVRTDPKASPTGFPFKILELEGTLGESEVYERRRRMPCDVGLLRTPYRRPDGTVGYRCPAEPIERYLEKGGRAEEAQGRLCLCNALLAAAGMPQYQKGGICEPAVVTAGTELSCIAALAGRRNSYGANEVIEYLLCENKIAREG